MVAYYRFYLLGYLCKKYIRFNEFLFNNKYVYAIGFVAFFARWYWGESCNMFVSFAGITGVIVILQNFLVDYVRLENPMMKSLSYIGQNTLEIFLIQYFFLPDLTGFIKPFIDVPNGFIWQLSLALILTIPITEACLFIGSIIKNNKLLSWLMLGK